MVTVQFSRYSDTIHCPRAFSNWLFQRYGVMVWASFSRSTGCTVITWLWASCSHI